MVAIHSGRATLFSLKFRSGCYVYGELQQRNNVHVDGVASIGIAADIHFGFSGRGDEIRFEGLMVVCPARDQPAPPEPPPDPRRDPRPDPFDDLIPTPVIEDRHEELFPYVYVAAGQG